MDGDMDGAMDSDMDQVRLIVSLVDRVLGGDHIGTYLHGSAVLDGLKPASDLDLLVVSGRAMDDRQRRALVAGLLTSSGAGAGTCIVGGTTARPVELSVVVQSEVRPWRYPPAGDFLYGEWLREQLAAGFLPQTRPTPDLALLIAAVLAGDSPVAGPPPALVLDPVPRADLIRASVDGIPDLVDELHSDTRNVVLTLARIWVTLATGEIRSKHAAADWALARLAPEHRAVLEHARELYLTRRYDEDCWDDQLAARLGAHVDHVLAELRRLPGR